MAASQTTSTPAQSAAWLRWLGVVFAVLGLGVAVYMSYAELTGQETSCPGATSEVEAGEVAVDCGLVQNSKYARVVGIPVAILGFFGYLGILAVWLLEDHVPFLGEYGHLLVFGMAFFGFLFSAFLTYTELFIMYTVCTWCLLSALFMTLVAIVATVRLVLSMRS